MLAPQSVPYETFTFALSDISIYDIQKLDLYNGRKLVCEVVLDGKLILKTSEALCPLAPRWDCSATFSARPTSVVSFHIFDEGSKGEILPDGSVLTKGRCVGAMSMLARDFCDSDKHARLQLRLKGVLEAISIALAVRSEKVIRPIPIPHVAIPSGMHWYEYFYHEKNMAWKGLYEWLAYYGYDVCFIATPPDGGATPLRPRMSTVGAREPFRPRPGEEYVYQTGQRGDYPMAWFDHNPVVRHAYDSSDRLVVVKIVGDAEGGGTNEIAIMQYFNAPERRFHRENRCLPVLDVFETSMGFSAMALPCWDERLVKPYGWQVDDYFETAVQAFEGLAFMHEHRVFHRDISPGNLTCNHLGDWPFSQASVPFPTITTYNYALAFLDFEFASQFPISTRMSDCKADDIRGTRGFMAPEVSSCEENPTPYELGPADVYALAATLFELLDAEGQRLQTNTTRSGAYGGVYAWRVLTELVPAFMRLLHDVMNAAPSSRPSAADMILHLRTLRETIPVELRFAAPEGYVAYAPLMLRAIQERLI